MQLSVNSYGATANRSSRRQYASSHPRARNAGSRSNLAVSERGDDVKKIAIAILGSCLAVHAAGATRFECDRSPLLVRNVDVWTPQGTQRARDVFIADGRIQDIAARGRAKAPSGTRVQDGKGQLMLPGLVDLHVHFVFPIGALLGEGRDATADALTFGRQLLASGVTSARVHLDSIEHATLLKELAADECAPMPRLQLGGPAFIPGSGTGDQYPVWDVSGVDDAVAKVKRGADLGFRWIAIHDLAAFPEASRLAIVDTARKLGVRILASGYTMAEVEASLGIMPDTLDYLDVSTTPEYPATLLERAKAQKNLVWVARIGIHDRYRFYQENPARLDDAAVYEFFDAPTAEALKQAVHKAIADRASQHAKRMDGAYPTMHGKFRQALASGVPLAMGTDVGSPAQFHRDAIWWEFDSWLKLGASADVAITASALNGGRVLYGDEPVGLRVGARADFVLCPPDTFDRQPVDGRGCQGYRSGLIAAK
jgi:imidazolonepropionase-like amidohydrolase